MSAVVKSNLDKKKMKTKSVFGYCNNIISRIVSPNSKSMLRTDAVPMENGSQHLAESNIENASNENQQTLPIVPSIATQVVPTSPMQLIYNSMQQANQNVTIESQQNFNFNNSNGLHLFGNTYHVAGSSSRKISYNGSFEDKATPKKTRSLVELMNCNDTIETPTMRIAARSIGDNWRMVFRDLEISDAEIAQIKEQYFHISVEEVIYQLLLRWQRNSDDPSIGRLSTVLWKNKSHECINELKKYYKELKKTQAESSEKEPEEKKFL
ncbi:protein immune deficiency [Sitodiplosis mosellana]|uniref:protein immune deficiency n=1 Tax=Sitodiplosis mosellana TaxID=263140 RepID=UPI00244392C8|nr:protein immune deficiency [Sitodiplosis mosellana]